MYEGARIKVANFINAPQSTEIVFTRNATEAINLVAYTWGYSNLKAGDEVPSLFFNPYFLKITSWCSSMPKGFQYQLQIYPVWYIGEELKINYVYG